HLDNSSLCATYCLILSSPSTAPTDIFTLSLHDALPISLVAYFAGADEVVEAEPEFLEALAKAGGVVISPSLRCHVPSLRSFHDLDRKSTRLNSSHVKISYAVFCLKKKNTNENPERSTEE